jgi:hypothetical protein
MDSVDTDFPPAWAAGAWAGGVLFEQVVDNIVAADGPNALTRARLLEELRNTTEFDANGWFGRIDFSTTLTISDCFVLLQVQNGEFVRVFPEEPGTLSCDPSYAVEVQSDPEDFSG